jgi:hypothetical protein
MNYKATQNPDTSTTEASDWILNYGSAYLKKVYSDRAESWFEVYLSERRKTDYPCWILIKTPTPLPKLTRTLNKQEKLIWEKHPESYFSADGSKLIIDNWQPGYSLTRSLDRMGDKYEENPIDYLNNKLVTTAVYMIFEYVFIGFLIAVSVACRSDVAPILYFFTSPFLHGIGRIDELEAEMKAIDPNYNKK